MRTPKPMPSDSVRSVSKNAQEAKINKIATFQTRRVPATILPPSNRKRPNNFEIEAPRRRNPANSVVITSNSVMTLKPANKVAHDFQKFHQTARPAGKRECRDRPKWSSPSRHR